MKNVRNKARDITTVLGGVCWTPMAVRMNDNTTIMRVKEVIIIKIEGASESTVISATIWISRPVTVPLPSCPRSMEIFCAHAPFDGKVSTAANKTRNKTGAITEYPNRIFFR